MCNTWVSFIRTNGTDSNISLAEIVRQQVDRVLSATSESITLICVRRKHLWEDSVLQFLKRSFDPRKPIRVVFHGEEAVDGGGPSREYFRLLGNAIKEQSNLFYCKGRVVTFNTSVSAYLERRYYLTGLMIATSILHGGPGFPFFPRVLYDYLSQRRAVCRVTVGDVANPEILQVITKVW